MAESVYGCVEVGDESSLFGVDVVGSGSEFQSDGEFG